MSRLVNVSNRVAIPKAASAPGGLAVGVLAAMGSTGGLWFGWSGETVPDDATEGSLHTIVRDDITFATIDIPETLHERSYSGFSNGTLWPLFHYFLDGFHYRQEEYQAYQAVNVLFARKLKPLLREDDVIWVHDYHLMPLAQELRGLGVRAPLGFFLHIPFPHHEVLRALPKFRELIHALLAFNVLGFQTEGDRKAFLGSVAEIWGSQCITADGNIELTDRTVMTGTFPIGVDVDAIARTASKALTSERVRIIKDDLRGRRLIIGVDRLDYSKGLLERFEAYRHFLEMCPQYHRQVRYLQIAPLGRQKVRAYGRVRQALEQSAGQTNGRFADVDWTPIRYLNRNFPHATLLGFLRLSDVCLVTPVRDGMNLVAKEFIAAQDPADPGVLVLSDRAGAADEMKQALLVNPYDASEIAAAIQQALAMPLEERRARYDALISGLRRNDIHAWYSRFLQALRQPHGRAPNPRGLQLLPRSP